MSTPRQLEPETKSLLQRPIVSFVVGVGSGLLVLILVAWGLRGFFDDRTLDLHHDFIRLRDRTARMPEEMPRSNSEVDSIEST